MSYCCNGCATDPVTKQKVAELEQSMEKNAGKDFQQDGQIARLFNMFGCQIKQAFVDYLDVMKASGELDELLSTVSEDVQPYYTGISTKKSTANGTDYYVTIVPKVDTEGKPMEWKMGVANDAYNGVGVESTIDFAHRKNATLAINAGVFNIDTDAPLGVLIKDGVILQNGAIPAEDKYQYLAIMEDGSFRAYPRTTAAGKMLADGAIYAVCIFGSLITSGQIVEQTDLRDEPRQSLGVRANGDIVIITADGRKPGEDAGMSYGELAQLHAAEGCMDAWILDGGGSTATVLRGVKQNDNVDYFYIDRPVNTFLYIAKPNTVEPSTNTANDLGKVKQQLIEQLAELIDFYKGYIRLRGPENYYAPGIEFYVNAEETRRAKVGMTIAKDNVRNSYFYISFKPGDSELANMFRIYEQGVYMQTYHGTSSERPNAPVGFMYFDETINKPIWKGNAGWVDATGTAV